jgi:hypothetical protein
MPYLDPEDKKAWRERYREKQRQHNRNWYAKNKPLPKPKKTTRAPTEIKADMACLSAVMRKLKIDIMIRDGVMQCSKCKKMLPMSGFCPSRQNKRSAQCKACECEQSAKWTKRNPEKYDIMKKKSYAKIISTPELLLKTRIRNRINKAIRAYGNGLYVSKGKLRYLGCTSEQVVAHIERQMNSRMTWENYGKTWNIDHIMPCASYDLTQEDDRKKCFHYTNLRPVFCRTNFRKNDKVTITQHQPELIYA